ncbi:hypothetical protein [Pontitalea aquivivens]|uniref:hypothetical protein n=1 Tax=Pontitalea aquivivens TaxID=3388663 RepID=UPI003970D114
MTKFGTFATENKNGNAKAVAWVKASTHDLFGGFSLSRGRDFARTFTNIRLETCHLQDRDDRGVQPPVFRA